MGLFSSELDRRSLDEFAQLLTALQAIYTDREPQKKYLQSWKILYLTPLMPEMAKPAIFLYQPSAIIDILSFHQ